MNLSEASIEACVSFPDPTTVTESGAWLSSIVVGWVELYGELINQFSINFTLLLFDSKIETFKSTHCHVLSIKSKANLKRR